ncbi:unnamed protein product (macronuclear) [Paramecium tetraurelia]|uniref:DUF4200 domain-containing protein n=1 Tax=Paramecium tetraurelia TaxID=5888 RepID=A0BMD1_PARTE|nr:uncharacterized protein GSPATT00030334001 [Paramecium tetraurelia]CAK59698.1 unnamed protein product [Paramecium tetraurelia]|eukprot:XP_001427096.1 hypothetical protein (macronuclear) [Paramecium tetraurelia strain d4-2]
MSEKLPQIHKVNKSDIQSPFRYPSDEEVFLFREQDRKKQEAQNNGEMHIWDKKTATNRTQLKHFKSYETQIDDKFKSKTAYNDKDKKVINEALQIIQERKKQRAKGVSKEPIVTLLEQKKEMFLVSKAHGIIEEEIDKLKLMSKEKKEALEQSLKMLETDNENFQKYLDTNKQQKLDAEQKADQEVKEKKAKESEIKSINIKITSLRAEKTRNEEAVNNYMDHKKFLDKLAPKEWHDAKEKKRQQLVNRLKEELIKIKGLSDKQFQQMVDNKKLDELEEFEDEYEMYFKQPSQLVEIFNDLEERNLFLIQTTQDAEQNLEELKTKFNKIKKSLDDKVFTLQQNKEQLKKNYENVCQQIKTLQLKGTEKNAKKDHKELRKQIIEVCENFPNEIQGVHDLQNKETLDILVQIELHLERQLKQIRSFRPDRVESFRQECERDWKVKQRDSNNLKLKQEEERRIKANQEKIMQPSKKKTGRQPMFRSKPFDRVIVQQEESVNNEELEDQKYFME